MMENGGVTPQDDGSASLASAGPAQPRELPRTNALQPASTKRFVYVELGVQRPVLFSPLEMLDLKPVVLSPIAGCYSAAFDPVASQGYS